MSSVNLIDSSVWQALDTQANRCAQELNLAQVLSDPERFNALSLSAPHVFLDCSKALWDESVLADLLELARAAELESRCADLYDGAVVNLTEQRPALHVRLRGQLANAGAAQDWRAGLQAMLALAQRLRAEGRFTDVVHIGIGGSSLGPELVLQALHPFSQGGPRVHVVSNMDEHSEAIQQRR